MNSDVTSVENIDDSSKINYVGLKTSKNARELINEEDIAEIQKEQKRVMTQLEKVNQMLIGCNNISEEQCIKLLGNFQKHTSVLVDMKKNLQFLHTHIRQLKMTLHEKYPETKKIMDAKKTVSVTSVVGLENENKE